MNFDNTRDKIREDKSMKAEYDDVMFVQGKKVFGSHKVIELPFSHVSARALIVRRKDSALLATLHNQGGRYALPGGAIDHGESPAEAVIRELREENIELVDNNNAWVSRVGVDYFDGYKELTVWYLFDVEDAVIGECDENVETRWFHQNEDVWHPLMREKILLLLNQFLPDLAEFNLQIN